MVNATPWPQGLGKVPECRFHGLVMPRGARAPAVLGRSIRPSVNDGRAPGRSQPEPGHDGTVASIISACGPIERFCDEVEACARHLLDVTGSLSAKPGHPA